MNHVYLERHDDNDNMHRFYQMFVTPGLFDDWSLIKEWFDCEEAAVIAGQKNLLQNYLLITENGFTLSH